MNSCEIVTFVSTLACIISKVVTTDELNLLSVIFSQLGDSLATISTVQSISNSDTNSDDNSC